MADINAPENPQVPETVDIKTADFVRAKNKDLKNKLGLIGDKLVGTPARFAAWGAFWTGQLGFAMGQNPNHLDSTTQFLIGTALIGATTGLTALVVSGTVEGQRHIQSAAPAEENKNE